MDSYISVYWNLEKAMGSQRLKKHLAESLFDVVIGTNDFLVYLNQSRPSLTPQQYVHLLLTSLDQQLKVQISCLISNISNVIYTVVWVEII